MTAQVNHVRKALDYLAGGRDAAAEEHAGRHPRRKSMSDCGCSSATSAWYAARPTGRETFPGSNPERRPARMPKTLRHSEE